MHYPYVIVGGGLAGASAIEGIRAHDKEGAILMFARENFSPYHRPPLSKDLWFGKKKRDELPVHPENFYRENKVELALRREAVEIDPRKRAVWHDRGTEYSYGKLLLATGGRPRAQIALVGVGIEPTTDLADAAGLDVGNGIEVDEYARTSDADIYAAGDVAEFPYLALDVRTRVEHWDHAIQHGRAAGANMAGANHPYTTLPMFYSDFFDLGWEAVGDVDSSLTVEPVWKEPLRQGVLFYLRDDVVRGVLLWNAWGLVDWARGLIREAKPMTSAERAARIPSEG